MPRWQGGSEIPRKVSSKIYALGPLGEPAIITPYLYMGERPVVIDCGPSSVIDRLLEELCEVGLVPAQIAYIAVTHVHTDHAGGAWKALEHMKNAKVLAPERGVKHLVDPSRLIPSARVVLGPIFDLWGDVQGIAPDRVTAMKNGDRIDLGGDSLMYAASYGHAPHHMIILDDRRNVFCGDALGIYNEKCDLMTPTTPPPSFDYEQSVEDIKKIDRLDPERLLLPHFTDLRFSHALIDGILETYRTWHDTVLEAFREGVPELASPRLLERFPEYEKCIAPEMLEQIQRIDVNGFIAYFERKFKAQLNI